MRSVKAFGIYLAAGGLLLAFGARAESGPTTYVWYRSASDCPEPGAFLSRLEARGTRARLAQVGDPVDFVVTLGVHDGVAQGLLERQTHTKTVAIRRLEGGSCDEVADALALSLSVSDTPEDHPADTGASVALPEQQQSPANDVPSPKPSPVRRESPNRVALAVGAQAGAVSGLTTVVSPAGAVYVEFDPRGPGIFRHASARAGALFTDVTTATDQLHVWTLAARFEGCPVRFGSDAVSIRPCAGVDIGSLRANGSGPRGVSDNGFWAAVEAGGRFEVRVAKPVYAEVQAAASIPLKRYDLVADGPPETVYRTGLIGVLALAGVGARFE